MNDKYDESIENEKLKILQMKEEMKKKIDDMTNEEFLKFVNERESKDKGDINNNAENEKEKKLISEIVKKSKIERKNKKLIRTIEKNRRREEEAKSYFRGL